MKKKPTDLGKNMTGIALSPLDGKAMAEYAAESPRAEGSEHDLQEQRESFARDSGPVGTVPPPASMKGLASAALDAIKGRKASAFTDMLGERLGFERTGARLYEALLAKYDADGVAADGPSRARLVEIHEDEVRHVGILEEAILSLGDDPTVMSPSADLGGVASTGLIQVVTDPRTTFDQCLQAILIAELADNEGWAMLSAMASGLDHPDLARMFNEALSEEARHLIDVKGWITSSLESNARIDLSVSAPAPPAP